MREAFKKGFAFLLVLFITLAPSNIVFASEVEVPGDTPNSEPLAAVADSIPSDGSTSTSSGTSSTPTPVGEVKITGYEIYNGQNSERVKSIDTDQQVVIHLTIKDQREDTFSLEPRATINTSSFRPVGAASKGDAEWSPTSQDGAYTLAFACQYTGVGNTFGVDISYPGGSIDMVTVTVTLNQCVEYIEPEKELEKEPEPEKEVTVKGTGFALKSMEYGTDTIFAGESFEINTILLATKGDYAVENVSISLVLPQEITPADGNTVKYFGTAQPGAEISASFSLMSDATAEQGSYTISMGVKGVSSEDGSEISASVDITVPIRQAERFEISKINLPEQLNASFDDGLGYTTVYFVNKGKTQIYNIEVYIAGEQLSVPDGNVFFGNLEAGTEGSVDFTLAAGATGTLQGTVVIKYENAQGIENDIYREFTIEATTGRVTVDPASEQLNVNITSESTTPAWVWIIVGVGSVVLLLAVRYLVKKRKAERSALLEEGVEDDAF